MSKFDENKAFIEDELQKKKYRARTIGTYLYWMRKLWEVYPNVNPKEFTFEQIKEFIDIKIHREKLKPNTVHQAAHTYTTIFNTIYNKNFDFDSIVLPKRTLEKVDVFTKDEIVRLLSNTDEFYKLLFATMYSAGLTLEELRNLRIKDVNTEHHQIAIYQSLGKQSRKAVLANYLKTELPDFLRLHKPQKWLFEGKFQESKFRQAQSKRISKKLSSKQG